MADEFSPWEQRLHEEGKVDDPMDIYLEQINQEVYGNSTRRKALHALLRLIFNTKTGHLTKAEIAEEAGLSTGDLALLKSYPSDIFLPETAVR